MEELLLDVINAVWAAERINELSPDNLLSLPGTEAELSAAIEAATGQDIVGDLAKAQLYEDLTFKEQARTLVDEAFAAGSDSVEANTKREAVADSLKLYQQLFAEE